MKPLKSLCRVLCLGAALLSASAAYTTELNNPLVESCAACHGQDGMATSEQYPNLAGQKAGYLQSQLSAFRSGERDNPAMTPLVQNLSDTDIAELASYYSALPSPTTTTESMNVAGQHVRARCISCHGMQGKTVNREWPNLAGQNAAYLKQQLMAFKSGARPSPIMAVIAQELTDQEIVDVSIYYSQL